MFVTEFPLNHVTELHIVPDFGSIFKQNKQRIKHPRKYFYDLCCYKEFATKMMPFWAKWRKLSRIKIIMYFFKMPEENGIGAVIWLLYKHRSMNTYDNERKWISILLVFQKYICYDTSNAYWWLYDTIFTNYPDFSTQLGTHP